MSEKPRTRRDFLKVAGAGVVGAAAAGGAAWWYLSSQQAPPVTPKTVTATATATATATTTAAPATKPPVTLNMTAWTYDIAKARQNANIFENYRNSMSGLGPVKVNLVDSPFGTYPDTMATRFMADTPTDVAYCSDHWMPKWADAGWIAPAEDYKPEIKNYLADIEEFCKAGITYKNKLYGLPYYADVETLIVNYDFLNRAGISAPPKTWDEVVSQSLTIKSKGIVDYPFAATWFADSWVEECFTAMVHSRGGSLFDQSNNPIFQQGSAAYDTAQWNADAINKHKIMSPKVVEMAVKEVKEAMMYGQAAFVLIPAYYMGEINARPSQVVGKADLAEMPGTTHETGGYMRFYAFGKHGVQKDFLDDSWRLMEFLGGKTDPLKEGTPSYFVSKRWAVENILGTPIKSLWDDAAVKAAFGKYLTVPVYTAQRAKARLKDGMQNPWYASWVVTLRSELQKAFMGTKSVADALTACASEWNKLKK